MLNKYTWIFDFSLSLEAAVALLFLASLGLAILIVSLDKREDGEIMLDQAIEIQKADFKKVTKK